MGNSFIKIVVCIVLLIFCLPYRSAEAQAIDCSSVNSPISEMICADKELRELNNSSRTLYSFVRETLDEQGGKNLWAEQSAWLSRRNEVCGLLKTNPFSTPKKTLAIRQCLIELYVRRISDLDNNWPGKLRNRVSPQNAYFTFVRSVTSGEEARLILTHLRSRFPGKKFSTYPPYPGSRLWRIASASYTDAKSANLARDVARKLGIAADAYVWKLPEPLSDAPEWKPVEDPLSLESEDPSVLATADKILKCYNKYGGNISIQMMRQCAGFWVTPRTLSLCALKTQCPALADTWENRAIMISYLRGYNMQVTDNLVLRVSDMPVTPSAEAIVNCRSVMKTQAQFEACVLLPMSSQKFPLVQECSNVGDALQMANCLARATRNDEFQTLVECVTAQSGQLADALNTCATVKTRAVEVQRLHSCISSAENSNEAKQCVLDNLPSNGKSSLECLWRANDTKSRLACVDQNVPQLGKFQAMLDCMQKNGSRQFSLSSCTSGLLNAPEYELALKCVESMKSDSAIDCVASAKPEIQNALYAYECLSSDSVSSTVLTKCANLIPGLDDKAAASVACLADAGDAREALLGCASRSVLPPETARYFGCATTSTGVAAFAVCAAAPMVNEEWRIAAECAVNSGGQPYVFAGCTASRLTAREITKCFTGQFGKDCFGPNNTIIAYYRTSFNDITRGPGKNNEIIKTINSIGSLIDSAIDEEEIGRRTRITIDERSGCNLARNASFGLVKC